jgi:Cu/Ag efflux protein CusF
MKLSTSRALFSGMVIFTMLAATAGPAIAHHSFTAFNMNEQMSVTGTVKQVDWTNPHIWIWIDVPDAKGVMSTYGFEGMSPNFLERRNWTRTTLKIGDKVTVSYRPLRDGKNGGMWINGKMESGKILTGSGGQ